MASATVVPETIANVSPPTGSACPVRMTVAAVLDTLNVACAQAIGSSGKNGHRQQDARPSLNRGHWCVLGRRQPAVRGGIPYRRAGVPPRLAGRDWKGLPVLRRGSATHSPPTQVQACRISQRNGPTGVNRFKPIRATALVPSAEGSIPFTSGSSNGGSGCSIKCGRCFRPEKPRRAFPVACGQQTPVHRGPRSQHPTGRRIGLGGAALDPARRPPSPPPMLMPCRTRSRNGSSMFPVPPPRLRAKKQQGRGAWPLPCIGSEPEPSGSLRHGYSYRRRRGNAVKSEM